MDKQEYVFSQDGRNIFNKISQYGSLDDLVHDNIIKHEIWGLKKVQVPENVKNALNDISNYVSKYCDYLRVSDAKGLKIPEIKDKEALSYLIEEGVIDEEYRYKSDAGATPKEKGILSFIYQHYGGKRLDATQKGILSFIHQHYGDRWFKFKDIYKQNKQIDKQTLESLAQKNLLDKIYILGEKISDFFYDKDVYFLNDLDSYVQEKISNKKPLRTAAKYAVEVGLAGAVVIGGVYYLVHTSDIGNVVVVDVYENYAENYIVDTGIKGVLENAILYGGSVLNGIIAFLTGYFKNKRIKEDTQRECENKHERVGQSLKLTKRLENLLKKYKELKETLNGVKGQ